MLITVAIPEMWTYLASHYLAFVWLVGFASTYFNRSKWFYKNVRKKILAIFNESGVVLLPCIISIVIL